MWVDRASFAKITASPAQVERRAAWPDLVTLSEKVGALNRGTGIYVGPEINKLVIDLMQRVSPAVADSINRHFIPFAKQAFDNWPVKSGLSKSLLAVELEPSGTASFAARLVNRAEYAGFIQKGELAKEVFRGGERAAEKMAADIAAEVAR